MKNPLVTLLFAILAFFFLFGCNSNRKTIKSNTESLTSTYAHIDEDSSMFKTESSTTQTQKDESINGTYEFTRIEFNNGTTFEDFFPGISKENMWNLWKSTYPDRKTEPPDSVSTENTISGIKAITTGKLDFNNEKKEQTENQTQEETNLQNSLIKELDTTSKITNNEISIEKEKHGFFYYFGVIACCFASGLIIYLFHKCINSLVNKFKS